MISSILFPILMLLSAEGHAAEKCPWRKVQTTSATMTTVVVNGAVYPVKGRANWTAFQHTLLTCKEEEAAQALKAWRFSRQATNLTAAVSLALPIFLLPLIPLDAALAGVQKRKMLNALSD